MSPSSLSTTSCVLTPHMGTLLAGGRWYYLDGSILKIIHQPAESFCCETESGQVKFMVPIIYSWCRNSQELSQPKHCATMHDINIEYRESLAVQPGLEISTVSHTYHWLSQLPCLNCYFILFPEAGGGEIVNVDLHDLWSRHYHQHSSLFTASVHWTTSWHFHREALHYWSEGARYYQTDRLAVQL